MERRTEVDRENTFKQLTPENRKIIEKLYKSKTYTEMAKILGCSSATVRRELNRCAPGMYSAKQAQIDADGKRQKKYRREIEPWNITLMKKQIETCIRMDKNVKAEDVANITKIQLAIVKKYFDDLKEKILTGKG